MFGVPYALLLAVGQWVLGAVLKKWPQFPNQFIPVATYVLAVFGYAVTPTTAHAGLLGDLFKNADVNLFLSALIQNILVTGSHSTWKNTLFPALSSLASWIFSRQPPANP